MKKIKKQKYSYIVDMSEIESLDDIAVVFALSKHNAGLTLSDNELFDIIEWTALKCAPVIKVCLVDCTCKCAKEEKKPWYKRFWNWLTKPFKKD